MIGLIIISHSKQLADGLLQLAEQMQNKQNCQIVIAAGVDDEQHPIGTDAIKVMEAVEQLSDAEHIILLMDLGSALLSAETALDLLDPELAKKVHLCSAPLVEGTIAITAAASSGATIETILNEAHRALHAKQQQLNDKVDTSNQQPTQTNVFTHQALKAQWVVRNPSGLHIRPAAKLASLLAGFDAKVELHNNDKRADAKSMNQIALLQVRKGDKITLIAEGSDSQAAINAFKQLAQHNFGDDITTSDDKYLIGKAAMLPSVTGFAYHKPANTAFSFPTYQTSEQELTKATQALEQLQAQLATLADSLSQQYGKSISDIFNGHSLLLDDAELLESIKQQIISQHRTAAEAIMSVFADMSQQYQQLDDTYLQARYIDIDDLKNQLLLLLSATNPLNPALTEPTILLADNLGPLELMRYKDTPVVGIALSNGSPYSHTCIIAAKMGLPMLVNLGEEIQSVPEHTKLTLSADSATLTMG
ncbi:dihydroxyacetone kinase phosphoryl donor subunit DhaM [Providencia manganoxydans]|uniref:dihydroxyacetone kinase phosphoryl donor subunit DhaM n=1 Tax=Providencia manganoxydans TaxID=2923283 RepID=UPI0034E4C055